MILSKKQLQLRAKILDTIYTRGPISRIDIATKTGITPATTSSITNDLIKENILLELGEDEHDTSVGRKKILLDIQAKRFYYIGCELSEKHFTFSLGDNLGNIFKEDKQLVTKELIQEEGTDLIIQSLKTFIEKCSDYFIEAIGIALPGRYLDDYKITTNNPLWQNINLNLLQSQVDLPVFFSNNVNCMAIGKRLFSRSQTDPNFAYFHFARGMHCSYIYNGKIYGKGNLMIGEIGHTVVSSEGENCGCGRKGCLQTFAGEAWLIKKAKILYQVSPHSILPSLVKDPNEIDIQTILNAYQLGDTGIITLIDQALLYLSQTILNISMMIDSQKIYLHSPLLANDTIIQKLYKELNYTPKLPYNRLPEVIVAPYNDFTAARSAIGLCLYHTILHL
ncbi:ROK family transcriptional regulator [Streptococcus mitis]|uniref:Putative ROK-family transcriptional regulator n=1 Tax=Streptococcus mitis TaxID=28037 RepID=A0A139Q3G8_STRMT|nr:ROK family transcriptional regulator [Streptococcus mitis]KXT96990.1 putative ROK-family transcriptional regulator [Streptococcus mitis]